MAKRSPSAKSTEELKKRGFIVAPVERWIPGANIRKDAFSFGDLLVAMPSSTEYEPQIGLVQVTSRSNMSAREKKIRSLPEFNKWCAAGGEVWLHGWNGNELTEKRIEP